MRKEKKEGEILSRAFVAKLLLSSFIFLLVSSSLFAEGPAQTLETQKDKESYSIGYQVGLSMKTDGVKVDFEKLIQGMHDATDGKVPRLSVDEMRNGKLDVSDVEWAATEIRNEYRRILDKDDLKLLRKVLENNRMEYNDRLRPLLQLLALLEYRDGDNWCDVHPLLRKLLDD